MKEDYYKSTIKTDKLGNMSMLCEYDMVGELVHQIARHKESLWRSFCKNVCEQVVTDLIGEVDIVDFRKVFNRTFEEETKKWMEL